MKTSDLKTPEAVKQFLARVEGHRSEISAEVKRLMLDLLCYAELDNFCSAPNWGGCFYC